MATAASPNITPPASLDPNHTGFKKDILGSKLEVKYLCSDCKNILRKPYQAQCGHRYCCNCLRKIISTGPQKCAACIQEGIYEEGISLLESNSAFPDNAARRELESLPAVCISNGCVWKGTIKEYEVTHEGKCPHMLVACPACKVLIRVNDRDWHNERECPERKLNCRYCKLSFYFPDIKAHDEICPKFPMTCEGCGKKKIPREKFQDHVKSCGRCKVSCRYLAVGCTELVENDKALEHESKFLADHLNKVWDFIQQKQNDHVDLSQRLGSLSVQASPAPFTSMPTPSDSSKMSDILPVAEMLEKKITTFENIVCVLNKEVERTSSVAEELAKQRRLDQDKIEALNTKVRQLERAINQKDNLLTEMETRIQETDLSTYDGIFIWKIPDFSKKRQDAIVGRCPAMFSPPFYTNKYGYKMCLRIYLNGDGTGRGSHLSLFFVVMKGPSDALLRWPFNQKVTLMLQDQNNREHVIDAFRPDITSSSFQRPVSEMNIASGCPLFCPLSKLEGKNSYIREDTIFIKVIVDLTGL
ncbi:TNF receptor-associated factor 2 isoform 1-T1 [Pelodytes ibericus]